MGHKIEFWGKNPQFYSTQDSQFQVVIKHNNNKSEYELYNISRASQIFYNMYDILRIGDQWSEHPIPGQIM